MQDLDQNLAETFEPIDRESPTKNTYNETMFFEKVEHCMSRNVLDKKHSKRDKVLRAESQECISHNDLEQESRTSRSDSCYQSLGMCEASTSHSDNLRHKQKICASSGSASLPYYELEKLVKPSSTLIPVRSTFTDERTQKTCPSDRLMETRTPSSVAKESSSSSMRNRSKKPERKCESEAVCHEHNRSYDVDDGPFSFSGGSSVSEEQNDGCDRVDVVKNGMLKIHLNMSDLDEKDRCSTEDVSDNEEQFKMVRYGCGREEVVRRLPLADNTQDRKL